MSSAVLKLITACLAIAVLAYFAFTCFQTDHQACQKHRRVRRDGAVLYAQDLLSRREPRTDCEPKSPGVGVLLALLALGFLVWAIVLALEMYDGWDREKLCWQPRCSGCQCWRGGAPVDPDKLPVLIVDSEGTDEGGDVEKIPL